MYRDLYLFGLFNSAPLLLNCFNIFFLGWHISACFICRLYAKWYLWGSRTRDNDLSVVRTTLQTTKPKRQNKTEEEEEADEPQYHR